MRRPLFFAVLALFLISTPHKANPEDKATGSVNVSETADIAAPEEVSSAEIPAPEEEKPQEEPGAIIILDGAFPEDAITQGIWEWDDSLKYGDSKSHSEPASEGITGHSYISAPVNVPDNCNIETYVYLDPAKPPQGILLRFRFEAEGKEGEIGVYKEGEKEVFIFNDDEAVIYDGILPEPGKWAKWSVDPDDLGLRGAKIAGISFVVYGGKANWARTRFVPSKRYKNNAN